jgi:hypothetical protein
VAKIPRARRYRVTRYGHRVMTAAITLHDHDYSVRYMPRPEQEPILSLATRKSSGDRFYCRTDDAISDAPCS